MCSFSNRAIHSYEWIRIVARLIEFCLARSFSAPQRQRCPQPMQRCMPPHNQVTSHTITHTHYTYAYTRMQYAHTLALLLLRQRVAVYAVMFHHDWTRCCIRTR